MTALPVQLPNIPPQPIRTTPSTDVQPIVYQDIQGSAPYRFPEDAERLFEKLHPIYCFISHQIILEMFKLSTDNLFCRNIGNATSLKMRLVQYLEFRSYRIELQKICACFTKTVAKLSVSDSRLQDLTDKMEAFKKVKEKTLVAISGFKQAVEPLAEKLSTERTQYASGPTPYFDQLVANALIYSAVKDGL